MDGVPTTTPARTVVDLAATTYPDRVARILDAAWASRLLGIGEVANIVAEVRGRGRAGVVLLDELLEQRRGQVRPGSALELRFEGLLQRVGFPPVRRQVHLYDEEGWIACVDYLVAEHPLVMFVDGARWHTARTDVELDDLQDRRLRAAGYLVERFSDAEILYDEPAVLRRARAALVLACSSAPIGAELQARTEKAKAKGTEKGTEKEAVKETESEDGIAKGGGVAA